MRRRPLPGGKRRGRRRRRELRVERQADDLVRRPLGDRTNRLGACRMPIAHRDKRAELGAQRRVERLRLRLGIGQQRRTAAELRIDVACRPRSPARDQPRQRQPQQPGSRMIAGSLNRVEQKRLDRVERIGAAEIHQHDRGPRHVSRASIGSAELSGKRRHMFRAAFRQHAMAEIEDPGPPSNDCRSRLTARSSAAPPTSRATGSRLPCTDSPRTQARAGELRRDRGVEPDRVDAGLDRVALVEQPGAARKTDDRTIRMPVLQPRNDPLSSGRSPSARTRSRAAPRPRCRTAEPPRRRPRSEPQEILIVASVSISISAPKPAGSR